MYPRFKVWILFPSERSRCLKACNKKFAINLIQCCWQHITYVASHVTSFVSRRNYVAWNRCDISSTMDVFINLHRKWPILGYLRQKFWHLCDESWNQDKKLQSIARLMSHLKEYVSCNTLVVTFYAEKIFLIPIWLPITHLNLHDFIHAHCSKNIKIYLIMLSTSSCYN